MTPEEHAEKTKRELEWPAVLSRVAAHCHSDVARERVLAWLPARALSEARERMERTRQAMRLCDEAPWPASRLDDHAEGFERVARGAGLDARELCSLGVMLEQASQLRGHLTRHAELAPALTEWLHVAPDLDALGQLIRRSVSPDGSILEGASESLRKLRRRAVDQRDELRQKLSKVLARLGEAVQGQYVAEREGRYVLPVRADAPFRVDGIVFGSSASGGTLYVEPTETHDLGNRVQRAEAEVRAEEARILRELNDAVGARLEAVREAAESCIRADCLRALWLYARRDQALPLSPESEPVIELRAMRHPLLLGEGAEVVPNDLSLAAGQALVLSGPNAGGKTVGLKCLGLAAWMVRSGIPVPAAEGSRVGFFDQVLSDIGDHQSLMHSLSTFSAHARHVAECLELSSQTTLILVDELAGGTDPDEGAALAGALLEALLDRGAAVCVTTHYDRLKSLAALDPRMRNAAVGFDRQKLAPTFQIEYGAPGASSAFLVAGRHGVGSQVIERAESLLPDTLLENRALSRELDEQREKFERATLEAESEKREVARLRRELERERRRAQREEHGRLSLETRELLAQVRDARAKLRQAEHALSRTDQGPQAIRQARRAANEAAQFVAIGGKLTEATQRVTGERKPSGPRPPDWESLSPGTRVSVVSLGKSGEVLAKPKRDQVTVGVGSMKLTVDVSSLRLLPGGREGAPGARERNVGGRATPQRSAKTSGLDGSAGGASSSAEAPRTGDNTVNLLGQRVDDALQELDGFIDSLMRDGEAIGFVLHGHGTGALKKAVRNHLSRHRCVTRSAPAEREDGGDAFTVLWLA